MAQRRESEMNKFANEMKKNVTRTVAGALAAISLSVAPMAATLPVHAQTITPAATTTTTQQNATQPVAVGDDSTVFPVFYPGSTITNDDTIPMKLVFITGDGSARADVTVPAQTTYTFQSSVTDFSVTATTSDCWVCIYQEENTIFFIPNNGVLPVTQ